MSVKALCITVLIFTVLIFGANHYAAWNEFQAEDCETCTCKITVTVQNPAQKQKPSCSVVFTIGGIRHQLSKESDSLRGELKTPDGTFNIVEGSQSGSAIRLQAERTIAGTQGKIILNGRLSSQTAGEDYLGHRSSIVAWAQR